MSNTITKTEKLEKIYETIADKSLKIGVSLIDKKDGIKKKFVAMDDGNLVFSFVKRIRSCTETQLPNYLYDESHKIIGHDILFGNIWEYFSQKDEEDKTNSLKKKLLLDKIVSLYSKKTEKIDNQSEDLVRIVFENM